MSAQKPMLTVFLFLIISFSARSQLMQDYIVNFKNDTIYGRLIYMLGAASRFETDNGSFSIGTTSIDSYFSAEHRTLFRRRSLPGKKRFLMLQCVEAGSISVYQTFSASASSPNGMYVNKTTVTYYAEKENNKLVEVWTNRGVFGNSNKTQKEALVSMIGDNPAVQQLMEQDKKYKEGDAVYYVHEYNKGGPAK